MTSPEFDPRFSHTTVTNTPQPDPEKGSLLTLYLMNPILIRVPDAAYFGFLGKPAEVKCHCAEEKSTEEKEFEEKEEQDKEMVERWKDEAEAVLTFVCAGSTVLCIFRSKELVQGWSVLSSWRSLHC